MTLLRNEIVKHILSNLGINSQAKSIIDKEFILKDKVNFVDISFPIYGCKISASSQEVKILLVKCLEDLQEYYVLVQLADKIPFGLFFIHEHEDNENSNIAYYSEFKNWVNCNTFLQASFLAGMEQIKDVGYSYNKLTNSELEYKSLISYIKYIQELNEI